MVILKEKQKQTNKKNTSAEGLELRLSLYVFNSAEVYKYLI